MRRSRASSKVASAKSRTQIQSFAGQLFTQLRMADEAFGEIADKVHMVRLDKVSRQEIVAVVEMATAFRISLAELLQALAA